MARNLIIQSIKAFKGIDVWSSFARSSPERALDCLNVIPSSSGGLEKLRIPPPLSSELVGLTAGPDGYTQYQQAGGLRQVLAQFGDTLVAYHADWTGGPVFIDPRIETGGVMDYVESNNLLFLTNLDIAFKWEGTAAREWGMRIPAAPPVLGAPIAGPLTFTNGGRRYRVSYGSSVTGHVSNASLISAATGNLAAQAQPVTFPASLNVEVDLVYLWSTVDGGGDFYLNQVITIVPLAAPAFTDTVLDANLNTALVAPLINDPPPLGKYLTRFGGRIFIGYLDDDPQAVAYSGYERILVGRPEESFPPNNRLKLAIGADPIGGMGAVANGLVIWSRSNEMFILRGVLQDITVSAPIQLTAFLQPMPWTTGCASHRSVAETPRGLVWLASDHTLQLFDGQGPPVTLAPGVAPLLRRLTPGKEENARGAYFKYLEREWYALTCALDGSLENNFFLVVDLDPNPETNVGAFPSSMNVAHVEVIEAAGGVRQLTVSATGLIYRVPANSDTVNGISDPITSAAPGSLEVGAYWRSGVFGNESPAMMKMFRFAHVVTDQTGFQAQWHVLKEDDNFRYPDVRSFQKVRSDGRLSVNQKGRRLYYEIKFPAFDASANLIELSHAYIPLSER